MRQELIDMIVESEINDLIRRIKSAVALIRPEMTLLDRIITDATQITVEMSQGYRTVCTVLDPVCQAAQALVVAHDQQIALVRHAMEHTFEE